MGVFVTEHGLMHPDQRTGSQLAPRHGARELKGTSLEPGTHILPAQVCPVPQEPLLCPMACGSPLLRRLTVRCRNRGSEGLKTVRPVGSQ